MAAAGRGQVALAGDPGGIGEGVVEVAVRGVGAAARRRAGRSTRTNQVLELAAGGVPVLSVAVIARSLGDRGERDVEVAHHVRGPVPGEHLPAQPVRTEHGRQLYKVHVGGGAEADGPGRALDLPLLRDPRPARLQVGDVGGHLRGLPPGQARQRHAGRPRRLRRIQPRRQQIQHHPALAPAASYGQPRSTIP